MTRKYKAHRTHTSNLFLEVEFFDEHNSDVYCGAITVYCVCGELVTLNYAGCTLPSFQIARELYSVCNLVARLLTTTSQKDCEDLLVDSRF